MRSGATSRGSRDDGGMHLSAGRLAAIICVLIFILFTLSAVCHKLMRTEDSDCWRFWMRHQGESGAGPRAAAAPLARRAPPCARCTHVC
jgi:hypothetical protein